MTLHTLLIFAGVLAIACFIPGPGIITLVSRTLGSGWVAGFGFLLGITLGDLLFVTLAFFGLSALAETMGELFQVIKWAGAAFLVYMAYKMITSKGETFKVNTDKSSKTPFYLDILSGFLLTLGNPKTLVFYAAIMPQFLDVTSISIYDFSYVLVTVSIVLIGVCSGYVWVATRAAKLFTNQRMQKRLSRASGAVLFATATWVALRA